MSLCSKALLAFLFISLINKSKDIILSAEEKEKRNKKMNRAPEKGTGTNMKMNMTKTSKLL